ncbi:MAG: sensor of ECF-type sigma factor [Flavobacteriaceae bacterium]|nr:sensor of ECF-type sigma factor [Flavobacteriaceae bacterium]
MKLKLPILSVIFIFQMFFSSAQNTDNENIRALKVVFITEQLELSPKEAEKFWPIYNLYTGKEFNLRIHETRKLRHQIKLSGGVEAISDNEADIILKRLIDIDNEIAATKNEMYLKLKPIIGSKKLIKLQIAEVEFNKKVLEEFRKKRMERMGRLKNN